MLNTIKKIGEILWGGVIFVAMAFAIIGGYLMQQRRVSNDAAQKESDKLQEEVYKAPMSDTYRAVNKRFS